MIEVKAADMRRAAALIAHHATRDYGGCNAVLAEVNDTGRISELITGILDLYQMLVPILHTETGVSVLRMLIVDMATREEVEP